MPLPKGVMEVVCLKCERTSTVLIGKENIPAWCPMPDEDDDGRICAGTIVLKSEYDRMKEAGLL